MQKIFSQSAMRVYNIFRSNKEVLKILNPLVPTKQHSKSPGGCGEQGVGKLCIGEFFTTYCRNLDIANYLEDRQRIIYLVRHRK